MVSHKRKPRPNPRHPCSPPRGSRCVRFHLDGKRCVLIMFGHCCVCGPGLQAEGTRPGLMRAAAKDPAAFVFYRWLRSSIRTTDNAMAALLCSALRVHASEIYFLVLLPSGPFELRDLILTSIDE